ncbi:MAG: PDGLE domain-containing protein [Candidatus Aureabacteria bacterium]|nr:PDGLE domain-containing protein [Candidatus Auribacterota bacterium]
MKGRDMLLGLCAALLLALLISPFASPWPDGLEKVAGDKGFLQKGEGKPVLAAPIPDYAWPGIRREGVATAVAGVAGTLIVFAVSWGVAFLLRKTTPPGCADCRQ